MALSVVEHGLASGPAVLYFHGWPSSRLESGYVADAAAAAGVRLVALDRPGFGLSDPQPKRQFVDWPRDVAAWADSVGLRRFGVLAFSGGSPYALACAAAIPERLSVVGVVSGMVPPDALKANPGVRPPAQLGLTLSGAAPWLTGVLWRKAARLWQAQPDAQVAGVLARLPDADRRALEAVRGVLIASTREAFRNGPQGVAWEAGLYAKSWGFRLADVRAPVRMWHGEADANVPVALARWVAGSIPGCRPEFVAGEGHYSTLLRGAERILRSLAAAA
jgi:pimeloyl-ACP methyl ester carboxylesterase